MRRIATAVAAGGAVSAAAFYYVTAPQDAPTAPPKQFERVPSRAHHLQTIQKSSRDNPFDILIVGGGATGTGCALDAATSSDIDRGLKTLLVEQEDFAAGTSSRSTKLVHGGVRYLERAVFGLDVGQLMLVFEALHERRTVLQLAPHLAKELPILTPCYLWWEVPFYWAGLKLYDLVAGASNLTWSRYVSAAESKKQFPSLAPARADGRTLKGTIRYHDGQFDDSRMAVMVACTAAQHGATVLNHMRCESLVKDEAGKVVGAVVWDQLTGRSQPVYARVVINATGPFTDELRRMSRQDAKGVVLPSAGVHVSLPSYYSPDACGLIVPSTKDGRVVFMLPWKGYTIAGTTDSKSDIGMLPRPTKQEVQFILEAISGFLNLQVRLDDVQSAWSGIRPLALDPSASSTAATSRDHVIVDEGDGMLTVTGGKWTTYRHMAEQAVDRAVAAAGMQHAGTCCTRGVPILGGDAFRPDMFIAVAQSYKVPHRPGYINIDIAHHLCESYGDQAFDITRLAEQRGLGRRLIPWHDVLEAEVVHAAQNEYCETAVDFLARRCRLAFIDVKAASMALPRVIELMAAELGWSRSRRAQEKAQALAFLDTFSAASD